MLFLGRLLFEPLSYCLCVSWHVLIWEKLKLSKDKKSSGHHVMILKDHGFVNKHFVQFLWFVSNKLHSCLSIPPPLVRSTLSSSPGTGPSLCERSRQTVLGSWPLWGVLLPGQLRLSLSSPWLRTLATSVELSHTNLWVCDLWCVTECDLWHVTCDIIWLITTPH